MKALVYNNFVVEISEATFEVHPEFIWMDAPDGCEYGWELVDGTLQAPAGPTDEEVAASVRFRRDALLAATDWWASTDLTMTAEQTAYRQALRDVPSQAGFPHDVVWPVKP